MEPKHSTDVGDLRESVAVLTKRRGTFILTVILVPLLAVAYSATREPVYRSSATVVLRPVVAPAAFQNSGGSSGPLGLDVSSEDEAQIAMSSAVTDRIPASLGTGSLEVQIMSDHLLTFVAEAGSARVASALADAHASGYLEYRRELTDKTLGELVAGWKAQLDNLSSDIAGLDREILATTVASTNADSESRRARLAAELNHLNSRRGDKVSRLNQIRARYEDAETVLGQSGGGGEVVQPALTPLRASKPRPIRAGALGLVFGVLLGIAFAFIREHLDGRIRNVRDVGKTVGVPVLAAIPRSDAWRKRDGAFLDSLAAADGGTAESYRALRDALTGAGVGGVFKTVLVTSGGPRAGKSALCANLAVQFGRVGKRVTLVSGDLRKPRVHSFFEASGERGLVDMVRLGSPLGQAGQTVVPNVVLVAAGSVDGSAAEVIDSVGLEATIRGIQDASDVVIIDSPPLSAGADAGALARFADVTLLVVRQDRARVDGTANAVSELAKVGARRIFAVLSVADEASRAYMGGGTELLQPEAPFDQTASPVTGLASVAPRPHAPRKTTKRATRAKESATE